LEKNSLIELLGTVPHEIGLKRRIRFHQGWWRTFVLNEPEGQNPARKEERVCNTILSGEISGKNFLSLEARRAVDTTLLERKKYQAGLLNEDRLFNNLLSSQPLAFNFFGPLKCDLSLATLALKPFLPVNSQVTDVLFEYAPKENYSRDHSAFDVAFEFEVGSQKELFGLECKYTDSFSKKEYSRESYKEIFSASSRFLGSYETFTSGNYNQLFRGQLIAESLVQNGKFDLVLTGIFCFQEYVNAIETGKSFQEMLKDGEKYFRIISYADFITSLQKLELPWEVREWSMRLWARYLGLTLSHEHFRLAHPS
jgi:hypothetical protein